MLDKSSLLTQNPSLRTKKTVVAIFMVILISTFYPVQASESSELSISDMENLDSVIAYRRQASKGNIGQSNSLYQKALADKDPAASVKHLHESILSYPSSRAFYKLVEYRLKQFHSSETDIKLRALNTAINHSQVALKLNGTDALLSDTMESNINDNLICMKVYLETKASNPKCEALSWINIR